MRGLGRLACVFLFFVLCCLSARQCGGERARQPQAPNNPPCAHTTTTKKPKQQNLAGQFSLSDERSTSDVVKGLLRDGYVPSWCTACYRKGRTGEHFMKIAKAGNIHNFCEPNSLLTLSEWAKDYGDDEAKALAETVLQRSQDTLSDGARRILDRKLKRVKAGEHDLYI